jgi:triacylglycerol lipase
MREALRSFERRIGALQHRVAYGSVHRIAGVRRSVIEVDGLRVPLLRGGCGRPMLLVHGFADRKETWAQMLPFLTRFAHVIVPDLPGFGDAEAVPLERTRVTAQSRFLQALLDRLDVPSVDLVGQSMGGAIAARMVYDAPERVRTVSLVAAAGPLGLHPELEAAVQAGRNPLLLEKRADLDEMLRWVMARPMALPRPMRSYVAHRLGGRRHHLEAIFEALIDHSAEDALPAEIEPTPHPGLVVYGAGERIVNPANAHMYLRALPNARYVLMPGVGHAPHMERPRLVARHVRNLVRSAASA